MSPFKVACEHCDASFKIADASKIGKRVKCPKCGEAFTIRKPADEDDFEDDDFDEEPAKPIRRGPAKKGGGSSKKAKSSEGLPVPLLIGGGVGVVVLLFAGLWLAGVFGGGSSRPQPVAAQAAPPPPPAGPSISAILDRLPVDTEVVMHFRLKDAMSSPLVTGLRTPEFDAQLKTPNPLIPGTTVSGMETITLALSNFTLQLSEQKRLGQTAATPPRTGPMPFPVEPLILVTLNDPLTAEFLGFPPESAVKHGSTTLYRRPQSMPGMPPCLAIIDPKVVALGTELQLKTLVDQPSGSSAAADFQLLDTRSQVAIAICPRNIVQQVERLAVNNVELPQMHRELHQFVGKGGKSIGLNLTFNSDLEAGVTVLASDPMKLPDLQTIVDAQVKAIQAGLNAPAAASNPMMAALKPVVEGIKVAATVDRVSASTVVPKDTLVGFGQMGMAMAGPLMMGPPPTGGPATPPTAAP
jgi:predicted Zn finger-like uncharacterized protein